MLAVALVSAVFQIASAFPRLCTDPKPVDLLAMALNEKASFPDGVEVVNSGGVKGYRFDKESITFGVNSESIFSRCNIFPSEFSVLLNFRHPAPRGGDEYLLTLLSQDRKTILFAIRLRGKSLHFEMVRERDFQLHSMRFPDVRFKDGDWHNVVLTASNKEVKLTVDCDEVSRKVEEPFAANLDTRKTRFYIASKRKKRKRFTGVFRQLILIPGSDAAPFVCPSSNPALASLEESLTLESTPRKGRIMKPVIFQEEQPYVTCSLRHKGQLLYTPDSSLKVCTGDEFREIKSSPPRMDYLVDYEDIRTVNQTIDMETFHIPGEGYFLATANKGGEERSRSGIYKWNGVKFELAQEVPSKEAQHFKHFAIGDEHFLALANSGSAKTAEVKSVIFRWLRRKKKFVRHQIIATYSARSWEAFTIADKHYLAVANHVDDRGNNNVDSAVYVWDPDTRLFLLHQKLPSVGAVDLEFFKIELRQTFNFIVVANTFNGQTTVLNSSIYYWESGKFILFQKIETAGASDWEFFEIDGRYYLAVANTFSFDKRVSNERFYDINSEIYELHLLQQRFLKIQAIPTHGGRDWEFFKVGANSYLIISNLVSTDGSPIQNVIYKWQGLEKFVPVHHLATGASTDFELLAISGNYYLLQSNPDWIVSKQFKVITY